MIVLPCARDLRQRIKKFLLGREDNISRPRLKSLQASFQLLNVIANGPRKPQLLASTLVDHDFESLGDGPAPTVHADNNLPPPFVSPVVDEDDLSVSYALEEKSVLNSQNT
jgi:hypothetical protein